MALTRKDIFLRVSLTLTESLRADKTDVREESTLQGDLGAESIDFLDIVFRLEREFSIKIPRGELFPESIFQGDPRHVDLRQGVLTRDGIKYLKDNLPFTDLSRFEKDPRLSKLPDIFTVKFLVDYITWKLVKTYGR